LVLRQAALQIFAIDLRSDADPKLVTAEELLGGLALPD
jgi:hypothetical protein